MAKNDIHHLRVSIPQKYNDRIEFASGVVLYIDTYWSHEEKVAYSARVTYVPKAGKLANAGIEIGDTVLFDYRVVGDGDMLPDHTRTHANEIRINGESEFFVAPYHLLAVMKEGKLVPWDRYVFAKPTMTAASFTSSILIVPDSAKAKPDYEKVIVTNIPEKCDNIKVGDIVSIKSDLAQKYNFTDKAGGDFKDSDTTIIIDYNYIVFKEAS